MADWKPFPAPSDALDNPDYSDNTGDEIPSYEKSSGFMYLTDCTPDSDNEEALELSRQWAQAKARDPSLFQMPLMPAGYSGNPLLEGRGSSNVQASGSSGVSDFTPAPVIQEADAQQSYSRAVSPGAPLSTTSYARAIQNPYQPQVGYPGKKIPEKRGSRNIFPIPKRFLRMFPRMIPGCSVPDPSDVSYIPPAPVIQESAAAIQQPLHNVSLRVFQDSLKPVGSPKIPLPVERGANMQVRDTSDVSDFTPESAVIEAAAPSQHFARDIDTGPGIKGVFQPEFYGKRDFLGLMDEADIHELRYWIRHHYQMIQGYIYFKESLEDIISQYMPNFRPGQVDKPSFLIEVLKTILPAKDRANILDIQKLYDILEGSTLAANAERHKRRVLDTVNYCENEVENLRHEVHQCNIYIADLKGMLASAQARISFLEDEKMFGSLPTEARFLADMQMHLTEKENMQSSLLAEVDRGRNTIARLSREMKKLQSELINIDHDRIQELAEIAKDVELDESLKKSLLEKIKSLNANSDECKKALDDWMNAIHATFAVKRDSIERTKEEVKILDDEVARQQAAVQDLSYQHDEMSHAIQVLRESIVQEQREYESLEDCISEFEQTSQGLADRRFKTSTPFRSVKPSDSIPFMDDSRSIPESFGSPERFRRGDSPVPFPRNLDDTASLSLDSSRAGRIPTISISPPSPTDLGSDQSFLLRSPVGPGTQTISQPLSRIFPGTGTVNPSTQTVKNRIDIGQSLNMQTFHSGTPSPFRQVTRVDSNVPLAGPSRLIDNPLNIQHMAEFTPRQFITPFISKTRFGYTDPKAKVLNLPPGEYDIDTTLRKKLLLTSPQRDEPLLVDIGVHPQPLVQTESGEHFICDISVDVQEAGKSQPVIQPVFTYGEPPAVTPTTTRRHGQFTPKGIFQKRHYNIRRVVGPHYESPGKFFSPHNLPFDSRSPVTSMPPSPYFSDGSISWEKIPDLGSTFDSSTMNSTFAASSPPVLNRTFDAPSPPVLNRTFDASSPPVLNRTFDASSPPVLNRTFDTSPPSAMNRTYEASPSPVIKGPSFLRRTGALDSTFDESSSPVHDRTFDISSSPGLGRTFDRSSYPGQNRTLDRSQPTVIQRRPSPRLDRTFNRSPSPITDRTFHMTSSPRFSTDGYYDNMSPLLNQTFERRMSPRLDRTYDRSTSPRLDGTYDLSTSPRSDATFARSMSPRLNATFDRSMSPRSDGTYDRSMSPRLDGTYDRSMSPRLNATFDRSMSPRLDGTYDLSTSPRLDATFDRNMSPRLNSTFNRSRSPRLGGTFDYSPSILNTAFDQSQSPQLDDAFVRSPSPRLDRTHNISPRSNVTFDRSRSPGLGGTFDDSHSVLNTAFDQSQSPRFDDAFVRSPSPRLDRTHNISPRSNVTFDRSRSPGLGGTFDDSHSVLNTAFDQSQSPRFDDAFVRSPSLRLDRTHNISPRSNVTFDRSSSTRLGDTFDDSPSLLNRAFDQSRSPQFDDSFSGSPSSKLDRTHKINISQKLNTTYDASSSPQQMDRTFDSTESPESNKTYDQSETSRRNVTFDDSSGYATMNNSHSSRESSRRNETFDDSSGYPLNSTFSSRDSSMSDQTWSNDSNTSSNQSKSYESSP